MDDWSWTTAAAWVGAIGALVNGLALWWFERKKARPDVGLSVKYRPGDRENGEGGGLYIIVHSASDLVVEHAGVSSPGRGWKRKRTELTGHAKTSTLPVVVAAGDKASIWVARADAVAAGVDTKQPVVGWVRGRGHYFVSDDAAAMEPEYWELDEATGQLVPDG